MIGILRRVRSRLVPGVGAPVWWAPKSVGLQITGVSRNDRGELIATMQGGEIIKNKRGRQYPRWTVQAKVKHMKWDAGLGMWYVGQGPRPQRAGEIIVTPDPVLVTGQAKGSFAVCR